MIRLQTITLSTVIGAIMNGLNLTHILLLYLVAVNLVTFFIYGIDKFKSKRAKWRVPEATLLGLAAVGGIWRKAMEQNVFIADEQSLYAALKIINMTWTQIKQAQNHEEVYKLANEMVERVGQFVKKYEDIGDALNKAQKAYEGGKAKLEDHGQSIVMSANKLIKLGAKNSKNPLPSMTDIDEVEGVELIEN